MAELPPLHVSALGLPGGEDRVECWVVDGLISLSPVPDAAEVAGEYAAPGMVDAHCHLSLDFANTALPFHSEELVLHNARRQLQAGVTAVRDAGFVKQLAPSQISFAERPIVQRSGWLLVPEGRYFPGEDVATHTALSISSNGWSGSPQAEPSGSSSLLTSRSRTSTCSLPR